MAIQTLASLAPCESPKTCQALMRSAGDARDLWLELVGAWMETGRLNYELGELRAAHRRTVCVAWAVAIVAAAVIYLIRKL
jgi:hypothetical protein